MFDIMGIKFRIMVIMLKIMTIMFDIMAIKFRIMVIVMKIMTIMFDIMSKAEGNNYFLR